MVDGQLQTNKDLGHWHECAFVDSCILIIRMIPSAEKAKQFCKVAPKM